MGGEVVHKEIASPVMGGIGIDVIRPIVELGVGRLQKTASKLVDGVAIDVLCQDRHAFVGPTQVDGMLVPVYHVLKFVGERAVIVGSARDGTIEADIEHFTLIAKWVDAGGVFILGGEVSTDVVAEAGGVEDSQVNIIIDARRPFAAKGGAVCGINL